MDVRGEHRIAEGIITVVSVSFKKSSLDHVPGRAAATFPRLPFPIFCEHTVTMEHAQQTIPYYLIPYINTRYL